MILEAGQYRNEQDFNQLEVQGYSELYYGGGLATSEDGSISILAGATLGGGTVVNYMNCIPTPASSLSAPSSVNTPTITLRSRSRRSSSPSEATASCSNSNPRE